MEKRHPTPTIKEEAPPSRSAKERGRECEVLVLDFVVAKEVDAWESLCLEARADCEVDREFVNRGEGEDFFDVEDCFAELAGDLIGEDFDVGVVLADVSLCVDVHVLVVVRGVDAVFNLSRDVDNLLTFHIIWN